MSDGNRVYPTMAALEAALDTMDPVRRQAAAAAASHAEAILQFLCSTFGDGHGRMVLTEDCIIVVTAEFSGDQPVEATFAVGPEGICACRSSIGETHLASTAPDTRSLLRGLVERLAEARVRVQEGASRG